MRSVQIENFFALAHCKRFSEAAEYCFITQPALSKNISALEDELGVTLFYRTSRGAELTEAGKYMYDFFQKGTEDYQNALKKARDLNNPSQVIRIALVEGVDYSIFWDFLCQFQEDIPLREIDFRFSEDGDRNISYQLFEKEIDCAVTFRSPITFYSLQNDWMQFIPIRLTRHRLYYSSLHPQTWGDRDPVPEDFKDSTFLLPVNTDRIRTKKGIMKIEDYFGEQIGFPIKCEFCERITTIFQNVIIDHGVTLMLDCAFSSLNERILSIPLEIEIDPSELVFVWRKDNDNEALQRLIRTFSTKYEIN